MVLLCRYHSGSLLNIQVDVLHSSSNAGAPPGAVAVCVLWWPYCLLLPKGQTFKNGTILSVPFLFFPSVGSNLKSVFTELLAAS